MMRYPHNLAFLARISVAHGVKVSQIHTPAHTRLKMHPVSRGFQCACTANEAVKSKKTKSYGSYPSEKLLKSVELAAKRSIRRLTLKELLSLGPIPSEKQLLEGVNYLQTELPRRLAARIMDLQKLPYIVGCNDNVYTVYLLYLEAFEALSAVPTITNLAEEAKYMKIIRENLSYHSIVVPTLAAATPEIAPYMNKDELRLFLDKMIRTRISRRVIVEQQLAMNRIFHTGPTSEDHQNNGIFSTNVCPAKLTKKLYRSLTRMCQRIYGDAPRLVVDGHRNIELTYIPVHLEFIMQELLKNAMRATMEARRSADEKPADIRVTVSKGADEVIIRISDKGGGIPPDMISQIFDYTFSTATVSDVPHMSAWEDGHLQSMQAGPAFGLPMARLYTEYFRGGLSLYSSHGYGTDVFVKLGLSLDTRETKQLL